MAKHNNYRRNLGTVSSGTMRPEDLIPDFIWELRQMRPLHREHRRLIREIEKDIAGPGDFYEDGDPAEALDELFTALNDYALPYFYFGAHPGDGSDYGFWLSESFQEDFDGLTVSGLSEVPTGHTGEVLRVNDHGNMTLYVYSLGRSRELWAVV